MAEIPFFSQAAVLDRYLKLRDLSSSEVDLIANALRSNTGLYKYFFRNRPDPTWAEQLLNHGYFINAPELRETDRGFFAPLWEEQEYLISIAAEVPTVVVEHVKRINGHGHYHARAIESLTEIPSSLVAEVLPVILERLGDSHIAFHISLPTLALVQSLAKNKDASAFSLFERVTIPLPPKPIAVQDRILSAGATALFPLDDYQGRTLATTAASLAELDISKTISILDGQLRETLRVEAEVTGDQNDQSWALWRSAVEDSAQNREASYKDRLLNALRDTVDRAAQENPAEISLLIEKYLADPIVIFRRLGLYLLSAFSGGFTELVARELLTTDNMDDIAIHHEYFTLLENGYPHLSPNEQSQLLNVIIMGLPQEELDCIAKWPEEGSEEERAAYAQSRSKIWSRDRLWMLRDYLDGEHKNLLDQLVKEFGKPDHPDFTSWMSGGYTVSDVSPITVEDLRQKSNEELLYYLKSWRPAMERSFGPERESYGALGREVASLIFGDLERYQSIVTEIASMHAHFATAMLNSQVPEDIFPSALEVRLGLCERLLGEERIRTRLDEGPDGRWVYFRFAAVQLCKELLVKGEDQMFMQYQERIRDLLLTLSNDPDPDLEVDSPTKEWFDKHDPLTVAINHVRSEAILSLIYYAARIARENGGRNLEGPVKDLLSTRVSGENDASLAVHSVFGRELNRLYWIDKEWVVNHIDQIFPTGDDEKSIALYVAAWDSYVLSTPSLYLELFSLLRSRYTRAIENIGKGLVTRTHLRPVAGISHHLLLEYQLAKYQIKSAEGQESLIAKFFTETLPEHRGEAVAAMSERLHQHPEEWSRTRELWSWRLEMASIANHTSDFKSEMDSFSDLLQSVPSTENLTTLWPLLEGFLPYLGDAEDWSRIWHNLENYLAKEVVRNSGAAIRFYNLMHERLAGVKDYYGDKAEKILRSGSSNASSRTETLLLIDKLVRKGNYQFKSIQDQILVSDVAVRPQ